MANDMVRYRGVVQGIGVSSLSVKIMKASSCASCSVKEHCSTVGSEEKIIEVDNVPCAAQCYKPGDEVWLVGADSMGRSAVLYGIVIPFLVLVVSLLVFSRLNISEPLMALGAFAMLVPYYSLLYVNKDKLKRKFSFFVMPKDDGMGEASRITLEMK